MRKKFLDKAYKIIGFDRQLDMSNWFKLDKKKQRRFLKYAGDHLRVLLKKWLISNNLFYYLTSRKEKKVVKRYVPPVTEDKRKKLVKAYFIICLKILNKIFTLNKNVKIRSYTTRQEECRCGWEDIYCDRCWGTWRYDYTKVDYDLRDSEYAEKTLLIRRVISLIREYNLPISYGYKEDKLWDKIIYFSVIRKWKLHQVSFHDPKRLIKCKPYPWEWIGVRNKKIPFWWVS